MPIHPLLDGEGLTTEVVVTTTGVAHGSTSTTGADVPVQPFEFFAVIRYEPGARFVKTLLVPNGPTFRL